MKRKTMKLPVFFFTAFIFACLALIIDCTTVTFTNRRSTPVYVMFNRPANWGPTCYPPFQPGTVCQVEVGPVGSSRFCTSLVTTQDCNDAQNLHMTMIETAFVQGGAVWVDVSVIPARCTTNDWNRDRCANTGGASYNVAVIVQCESGTFVCRGPPGENGYPTNCGNPQSSQCINQNGNPSCTQAYYFPNPPLQPVLQCSYLNVTLIDY